MDAWRSIDFPSRAHCLAAVATICCAAHNCWRPDHIHKRAFCTRPDPASCRSRHSHPTPDRPRFHPPLWPMPCPIHNFLRKFWGSITSPESAGCRGKATIQESESCDRRGISLSVRRWDTFNDVYEPVRKSEREEAEVDDVTFARAKLGFEPDEKQTEVLLSSAKRG